MHIDDLLFSLTHGDFGEEISTLTMNGCGGFRHELGGLDTDGVLKTNLPQCPIEEVEGSLTCVHSPSRERLMDAFDRIGASGILDPEEAESIIDEIQEADIQFNQLDHLIRDRATFLLENWKGSDPEEWRDYVRRDPEIRGYLQDYEIFTFLFAQLREEAVVGVELMSVLRHENNLKKQLENQQTANLTA